MIKEMLKAVSDVLSATFPTIEINATSVNEGFSKSSFFREIDNFKSSAMDPLTVEYSATVRIVYFPSKVDGNEVELTEKLQALSSAFQINLPIGPGIIADIQEFEGRTNDGVTSVSFDIQFVAELPDGDSSELMQELKYK